MLNPLMAVRERRRRTSFVATQEGVPKNQVPRILLKVSPVSRLVSGSVISDLKAEKFYLFLQVYIDP